MTDKELKFVVSFCHGFLSTEKGFPYDHETEDEILRKIKRFIDSPQQFERDALKEIDDLLGESS